MNIDKFISILAIVLTMALVSTVPAALAGTVGTPVEAGGAFSVPVTSIKEQRFRGTIHQQFDFSCGSAALATMLTHHYNYPVDEQAVFQEMYERGDKDKIHREGFSLYDMKLYLDAHGFDGDGFVADVDRLNIAKIPAIVLVNENGYNHFVVVKGVKDGRVLVGDPSIGTRAIPRERFEAMWKNRILFVVRNRQEVAQFNAATDWKIAPKAPLGDGLHRGAFDLLPFRRGAWDF